MNTEPRMTVLDALTSPTITPEILRVRIDYWLRFADRNERAGRIDQAKRLRRNCRAMKEQARSIRLAAIVAITPQVEKPEPKARLISAVAFWELHGRAIEAIHAVYGGGWKCAAPIGETVLLSIPPRLRSYRTERGGQVRYRRDHRMPAAKYWPEGIIPGGCVESPDYARDTRECEWGPETEYRGDYSAWQSAWARREGLTMIDGVYYTAAEREVVEARTQEEPVSRARNRRMRHRQRYAIAA